MYLGRWEKALCPKVGTNEMLTNENLSVTLLSTHACTRGPWFFEVGIESEHPCICWRMLCGRMEFIGRPLNSKKLISYPCSKTFLVPSAVMFLNPLQYSLAWQAARWQWEIWRLKCTFCQQASMCDLQKGPKALVSPFLTRSWSGAWEEFWVRVVSFLLVLKF